MKQPIKRAHREQDEAEIEVRRGRHRHVGRHHHAGAALQDRDRGDGGADDHQREREPADARRGEPRAQQHRGAEVQQRDLEKDDPHQQRHDAVAREHLVEHLRVEDLHGRPAGEGDEQPQQAADHQEHHCGHRVGLDQVLRGLVEHQARFRAGAVERFHYSLLPVSGQSTTYNLPSIV
jgi:hypothetical protein